MANLGSDKHRRKWPTVAGVAALLGIWYGLPNTPVQASACRAVPANEWLPDQVCSEPFQQLTPEEATEAIDAFLAKAGGASPQHAFAMLSSDLRAEHTGFVEGWAPILLADRVEDLEAVPGGFNEYTVVYVTYDGEGRDVDPFAGDVNVYEQEIGLVREGSAIRVIRYSGQNRLDGERRVYMQEVPGDWAKTYDGPTRDDVAAPRVEPQQVLSLLCQQQDETGAWWSRTGWGWIPHQDLEGSEGQRSGVPVCGVNS